MEASSRTADSFTAGPAKGELALHRSLPCASELACAALAGDLRAGRWFRPFEMLLLQCRTPRVAPSMMSV
jgi:hypothetical protein